VTQAAFDLDEDGLKSALAVLGYDAKVRTAFIMEALTQYLAIAAVTRLLQFMSNAAPGSRAIFHLRPRGRHWLLSVSRLLQSVVGAST
jgi:O-methyltransferase involved in polyketide biosynthesis